MVVAARRATHADGVAALQIVDQLLLAADLDLVFFISGVAGDVVPVVVTMGIKHFADLFAFADYVAADLP